MLCLCRNGNCTDVDPYFIDMKSLCCACAVVETALTSILISKVTMLCHCAVVETALRLTLISKVTMLCLCRSGNWLYLIIIYNVFLVGRE